MTDHQAPRHLTQQRTGPAHRVHDAQAVEAEAAQAKALRPVPGHGVERRRLRHGGVESGVEGRHLGQRGPGLGHGVDAGQRGRVVQRRQRGQLRDRRAHAGVDHYRLAEGRAPVDHAVPHRVDGREPLQHRPRFGGVPPRVLLRPRFRPLHRDRLRRGIEHRPLERAGAGIEHEYPRHVPLRFTT